jgi:lysozyme
MTLSAAGDQFIKDFEAFRSTAYPDSKGVWTIGFGTTRINGVPVRPGMTCSMEQALEWKRQDVAQFLPVIARLVRAPLNQNQIDALVSFVYNVGPGGFQASSLLKTINAGAPVTEDLFTRWNKIRDPRTGQLIVLNGLTRRRRAEYQLFTS